MIKDAESLFKTREKEYQKPLTRLRVSCELKLRPWFPGVVNELQDTRASHCLLAGREGISPLGAEDLRLGRSEADRCRFESKLCDFLPL